LVIEGNGENRCLLHWEKFKTMKGSNLIAPDAAVRKTKKGIYEKASLFALTLSLSLSANAQDWQLDWARNFGASGQMINSKAVATDNAGNVYITGTFKGTVDFDPSAGTANLTSTGSIQDMFIAKYNAGGSYIWAKALSGSYQSVSNGIAVDGSGNVYIAGCFAYTVDFDGDAGTANLTAAGTGNAYDIFIAKYDNNGVYQWAKGIGNSSHDKAMGLAQDGSGNLYLTGQFSGTVDFDPSAGTANVAAGCSSSTNIFIAKYDPNGGYIWAKGMSGCTSGDIGNDIAVDASGNAYVTGSFKATVDFDPDAGTANLTAANEDIFLAKYDNNGAYQWAHNFGSVSIDAGRCVALDGAGGVYISGEVMGNTADFDPSAGTATVGAFDGSYLAKYDQSGNYKWVKGYSYSSSHGHAIAANASGVYVGFKPLDGVLHKYSATGDSLWTGEFTYTAISDILPVADTIYFTGYFTGTTDFDPSAATANLSAIGTNDGFVAKLKKNASTAVNQVRNQDNLFTIYPNPANGQINLTLPQGGARVLITDMQGKALRQYDLRAFKAQIAPELPAGTYLVYVSNAGLEMAQKLVIQ
jgi:hypothetical protein